MLKVSSPAMHFTVDTAYFCFPVCSASLPGRSLMGVEFRDERHKVLDARGRASLQASAQQLRDCGHCTGLTPPWGKGALSSLIPAVKV